MALCLALSLATRPRSCWLAELPSMAHRPSNLLPSPLEDGDKLHIEPMPSKFAKGSAKNAFPLSEGSLKGSSSSCDRTATSRSADITDFNIGSNYLLYSSVESIKTPH